MINQLPQREFVFDVDIIGEATQQKYQGRFTSKAVLTIGERIEMEREISSFTSEFANPTPNLSNLSVMLANIKYHVIKCPDWWDINTNGTDLLDLNVVTEIFAKLVEGKDDWYKKLDKNAKNAPKSAMTEEDKKEAKKKDPLE
jgi:hypothetical protein